MFKSSDALQAIAIIADNIASGTITPNEGESLSKIIDTYVKAIEVYEYENRLQALERKERQ